MTRLHKKGGKDLNKGKKLTVAGRTCTKEKPTQGTRKACTQKGSLELKTCKQLRGEYTHTQYTRYLIDFAEIEQENHTRTQNTRRGARYLIDFTVKEQPQQHWTKSLRDSEAWSHILGENNSVCDMSIFFYSVRVSGVRRRLCSVLLNRSVCALPCGL